MGSLKSVFDATKSWASQRQIEFESFEEIGSTNDEAKQNAFIDQDPLKLYLAAHQTKGRGRGNNTWLDTGSGDNLLSSWSFALEHAPQAIAGPRFGEALYRSSVAIWPALEWSIKAPNDLYLGSQKMAGLLIESVSKGEAHRIIVGLGMNILNHPRSIPTATHFSAQAAGETIGEDEWYQFLDVLLGQFRSGLDDIQLPHLTREVRDNLLKALNAFPSKKETYLDVQSNGDLVTKSGKIPWMNQ